jgi:hypothetical protein
VVYASSTLTVIASPLFRASFQPSVTMPCAWDTLTSLFYSIVTGVIAVHEDKSVLMPNVQELKRMHGKPRIQLYTPRLLIFLRPTVTAIPSTSTHYAFLVFSIFEDHPSLTRTWGESLHHRLPMS